MPGKGQINSVPNRVKTTPAISHEKMIDINVIKLKEKRDEKSNELYCSIGKYNIGTNCSRRDDPMRD